MKIGIFGGTFNPPHNGHLSAASAFAKAVALDCLLVIPTFLPPHKSVDAVSSYHRLEMTRLAFSDFPISTVSDIEIERGGISYTADTLRSLWKREDSLYLLCGTDMFLSLDTWHEPQTIFDLSTVCYIARDFSLENDVRMQAKEAEYKEKYHADVFRIQNPNVVDISSSHIRDEIRLRQDVSSMIPKKVLDYMAEERLYI